MSKAMPWPPPTQALDHRCTDTFVHPHVIEGIEKSGLTHFEAFSNELKGGLQNEVQSLFMQCDHGVCAV